jgi:hypothetical protein
MPFLKKGKSSSKVSVRAYASPTAVFLAFDWAAGKDHGDFLGFAIKRSPGYGKNRPQDYLFNKLTFDPPKQNDKSKPVGSDKAPIQKFMWWDGGVNTAQRGTELTYTVTPVLGTGPNDLNLLAADESSCTVRVPTIVDPDGIGFYFNRAVVSSQAFKEKYSSAKNLNAAMEWLANGLQDAIPTFLQSAASSSHEVLGAFIT